MSVERESLKPIEGASRPSRRRIGLRGEFALAVGPTLTVLCVLGLVEALSRHEPKTAEDSLQTLSGITYPA
jgi:hypothetical protein